MRCIDQLNNHILWLTVQLSKLPAEDDMAYSAWDYETLQELLANAYDNLDTANGMACRSLTNA